MPYNVKIRFRNDKGATLLVVAAALAVILGMCALAIDLVTGYLARVQCQRAADAAALAGAQAIADYGCTSSGGCFAGQAQDTIARQAAYSVAAQNPVMGLAPTQSTVDVTFDYTHDLTSTGGSQEPQVTVTVHRDSASGDPLPTMFAKIFGINYMNISAQATAEAYNGRVGAGCIKPFLVPNCDPNFPVTYGDTNANHNCTCGGGGVTQGDCPSGFSYDPSNPTGSNSYYMSYYVNPTLKEVVHPGVCVWNGTRCLDPSVSPTSGDIGAPWTLHNNLNANVPSQWYTIAFTTQSGEAYSTYIAQCAPEIVACGSSLDTLNGKKVGPTNTGIQTLIQASGQANPPNFSQGQDYMCSPSYPWPMGSTSYCSSLPFPIYGGANNKYNEAGTQFDLTSGTSDSLANVVLYDGTPISSGGATVVVQGYMSIFIQGVDHKSGTDDVYAVITQIGACGSGLTGPSTSTVSSNGGSFIPVRLIHQ